MTSAGRRHAPATARNSDPILEVLRRVLPSTGTVLEIASGSGEHAVFMARNLPGLIWQPSDLDADARSSIDAWRQHELLANMREPLAIDAETDHWDIDAADAIVCINMVHISPWTATEGVIRGAARLLPTDGVLYLYGPYRIDGRQTAPSNEAFDADLQSRNPAWGVRRSGAVQVLAETNGLKLTEIVDMPANNFSLIFRKAS